MIQFVEGLPGAGKTILAVRWMLEARKEGRECLANFHCKTDAWQFGLWDDMKHADNKLCMIDEAYMWFNSRNYREQSTGDLAVFKQSRKNGMDLVCIDQAFERVDVAIREVTAFVWKTKKVGQFFVLKKFEPGRENKPLARKVWRFQPELARHYWTEQYIGSRDGDGYGFGKGSRYAAGGGAAALVKVGGRLVFVPNVFRLELPHGSAWIHADDPYFHERLNEAVRGWRLYGLKREPESLVASFYSSGQGGHMSEIDTNGLLVPGTAAPGMLGMIIDAFRDGFGLPPRQIGEGAGCAIARAPAGRKR
jgi:hypothetical protein